MKLLVGAEFPKAITRSVLAWFEDGHSNALSEKWYERRVEKRRRSKTKTKKQEPEKETIKKPHNRIWKIFLFRKCVLFENQISDCRLDGVVLHSAATSTKKKIQKIQKIAKNGIFLMKYSNLVIYLEIFPKIWFPGKVLILKSYWQWNFF